MKTRTAAVAAAAMLLGTGMAAQYHADAAPAGATKTVVTKEVHNKYSFAPAKTTVKVGTIVVWQNKTDTAHNVTFSAPGGKVNKDFKAGKHVSFKFSKAGTYKYHCEYHPYMKATIVVTH